MVPFAKREAEWAQLRVSEIWLGLHVVDASGRLPGGHKEKIAERRHGGSVLVEEVGVSIADVLAERNWDSNGREIRRR